MITQNDLNELEKAYARGILKVREGDTWIEYQGMREMRIAIKEFKAEMSGNKPSGTHRVTVSKGY